jgi:hypothetical protein
MFMVGVQMQLGRFACKNENNYNSRLAEMMAYFEVS